MWSKIIKINLVILLLIWCFQGTYKIYERELEIGDNCESRPTVGNVEKREKKKIALTFDDGPSNVKGGTEYLVEGLSERGVKATFFLLGKSAIAYPEIVKSVYEAGHLIGNHSYHHVDLTSISEQEFMVELEMTNQVISEVTGNSVEFMRPPFGEWERSLEEQTDMMPVFWSIDSLDWTTDNVEQIVRNVVTSVKENDIILMHDCYASTSEAAFQIIDILQEQGFEFVTVDELLLN